MDVFYLICTDKDYFNKIANGMIIIFIGKRVLLLQIQRRSIPQRGLPKFPT
jgi:hypothetical protein